MIVVTGAAGFIGSALLGELERMGYGDLIALDDFSVQAKSANCQNKRITQFVERSEFFGWLSDNSKRIQFIFHIGARTRTDEFDEAVLVRHIIGLDPGREAVAIAQSVEVGMQLTFCQRNATAARADLMRIGAEIREALEPEEMTAELAGALNTDTDNQPHPARRMAGAIYVSCAGRGGPHFGSPSAELNIVRRALGDVPLVGFFAGGEIAHQDLYGYTGVLTVFTA